MSLKTRRKANEMDLIELDAQILSISHYLIYVVSQKGVAL